MIISKTKKLLGLFTVLCMLVALVPVSVSAYAATGTTFNDGTFEYKVLADTSTVVVTKNLIAASLSGAVVVPGTVDYLDDTYTVTQLGGVFDTRNSGNRVTGITSITLPDTITKFTGTATFYGCSGLTSIHLPSALTGDNVNGQLTNTFYFCPNLEYVEIPAGITKLSGTFQNSGVRTVKLLGTSATNFYQYLPAEQASQRAWTAGTKDAKVYVTVFYPDGAEPADQPGGFYVYLTWEKYNATRFTRDGVWYDIIEDTSNVKISDLDSTLTGEVTIPSTVSDGVNTYTVTQLGDAFKCTTPALEAKTVGMTSLTLPDTITEFTGTATFYACKGLTSIHLPSALTGDKTGTGYLTNTFYYCSNLNSVYIPSGITKFSGTFRNSGVISVILGATSAANFYQNNEDARAWNSGVINIRIVYPSTAPTNYNGSFTATAGKYTGYTDGFAYDINGGGARVLANVNVGEVTVPDTLGGQNVWFVGGYVFARQRHITKITLSDNITKLATAAFQDCSGLTSVKLSKNLTTADGASGAAGTIKNTFLGCTSLETVIIPPGLYNFVSTFSNTTKGYTTNSVKTIILTSTTAANFNMDSGINTNDLSFANSLNVDGVSGIVVYYPETVGSPTKYDYNNTTLALKTYDSTKDLVVTDPAVVGEDLDVFVANHKTTDFSNSDLRAICAVYDNAGNLLSVDIKEVNGGEIGSQETFEVQFNNNVKYESSTKPAKVFIWNIDTRAPIVKPLSLD